jgi:cell division protein FtsW
MFRTMGEKSNVNSRRRTSSDRRPADTSDSTRSAASSASSTGATRRRTYNTVAGTFVPPATTSSAGRGIFPAMGRGGRSNASQGLVGERNRAAQLHMDVPLLLSVITLVVFGLVMLYSASFDYSRQFYGDASQIFVRQLIWLGLGLTIAVVLTFVDYHLWRYFVVPAVGITLFMLLVVLFMNNVLNGAMRTIVGGSVQPSEAAKLVTVLYLSVWLFSKREQLGKVSFGLVPLAMILGVLSGFIALQPDFSAVVTILALGGLLFFLAGGDLKQIGLLLLIALVVGWVIVNLSTTGHLRITDYLAGLKDPTAASYHVKRSFEAFVNGSWFGTGIGLAVTKFTGLPVPPTDSIFAVVGEETGVAGSVCLILVYIILLWRGLTVARRAPDQLGMLMAAGLSLWIAMEAFINMGVMVNLLPFAGNALPFISAGGSNLVMSLAAVGILLNISRLSERRREENGDFFNAVVNLRWRDRRRSVSGSGRAANAVPSEADHGGSA